MKDVQTAQPRRRMSKQDRRAQLLRVARELIHDEGTDGLTLARIAERAGVTKPVVYDHFGSRAGVLEELYREFDARQHTMLDAALRDAGPEPGIVADLVAGAYIGCTLAEGRELADVIAALAGSPSLDRLRQDAEDAYIAKCRTALAPFIGPSSLDAAGARAIVGAGDALARAAAMGQIGAEHARTTLTTVIIAITAGSRPDAPE